MKRAIKILLSSFLVVLGLSGCVSKIMNPYGEDFSCPQMEKGKCVPIKQAYLESLQEKVAKIFTPPKENKRKENEKKENETSFNLQDVFLQNEEGSYGKYNEALMRKLQQMLENPKTPVLIPPQVVRVLILPYAVERDTFYSGRYVYMIVEDSQWVFHNILNMQESGE
jgi:conjugal transfer pilus assembly protein TraV